MTRPSTAYHKDKRRHRASVRCAVSLAWLTCASSTMTAQSLATDSIGDRAARPASAVAPTRYTAPLLYPPQLGPSDRAYWSIAAGALVAGGFADRTAGPVIRGYRTPFLTSIAPIGNVFGTANYTVPTVMSTLVLAHVIRNANWEDATRHITMSYILADATEALLKGAVGRQRPAYSGNPWIFKPAISTSGEYQSFPSGHVTHITAIAAAFAEEAHRPWITALGAGAVVFTAWQRLYLNQHWASDVIGGMIVGTAASRITAHWLRHRRHTALPVPTPPLR